MAGSMKDIKLRIKSVESTMQITKAMELVASSKMRRAKERVEHSRPYFETLYASLTKIAAADPRARNPYLRRDEINRTLLIVIAGDRGLAGGYNANIFKQADAHEGPVTVLPIGKRAAENFAQHGAELFTQEVLLAADISVGECFQLSRSIPVFKSANMSMGINVLSELCKRASAILGANYDIEIVEQHHHNKLDAPSGTALMLADAINEENDGAYHYVYDRSSVRQKRDPKEIGISAVRGGSIVGDHEVLFCGPDEVITLRHTAYSRNIFANGAINAAVYLAKKEPGLYNMSNMIAEM